MKGITTLLFDIDGTVLDTTEFILQATEHALKVCGYSVPDRSVICSTVGKSFPGYYLDLAGDDADTDKLITTHRDFQLEHFDLSIPFKNTVEVLKELKARGYKLAAVTTRHKHTSHPTLIKAGIFDLFSVIITTDLVKKTKPDPAPLLMAMEYLKETPDKAVMIGDSHLDIQAGKNAGTKTIRAVYGFHAESLHDPEPDFVIEDIKDLLKLLP